MVWSLTFYLLENIDESHMEQNFVTTTLNAAFNLLAGGINIQLHQTIFKVRFQDILSYFYLYSLIHFRA